jgi:hypothetical protein
MLNHTKNNLANMVLDRFDLNSTKNKTQLIQTIKYVIKAIDFFSTFELNNPNKGIIAIVPNSVYENSIGICSTPASIPISSLIGRNK